VRVRADGFTPAGLVTVTLPNGDTLRDRLDNGRLGLTLPKFPGAGTKVLTIAYVANPNPAAASSAYAIMVDRTGSPPPPPPPPGTLGRVDVICGGAGE